jgi:hypothetical protein
LELARQLVERRTDEFLKVLFAVMPVSAHGSVIAPSVLTRCARGRSLSPQASSRTRTPGRRNPLLGQARRPRQLAVTTSRLENAQGRQVGATALVPSAEPRQRVHTGDQDGGRQPLASVV